MRVSRLLYGLVLGAALTLPFALPATAERLVIEGRAAQALHCATMLGIVSIVVHDAGLMSDRDFELMAGGTMRMLDHVPGTQAQKKKAVEQRARKIFQTRTVDQLAREFDSTLRFCMKNFM